MDNKTVAIVDDDLDDLLLMTDAMTRFNESLEVRIFYTPEDVIESLVDKREAPPFCIFIDINMPRINGGELLRRLRGNPHLDVVKIVMLSTFISDDQRETLIRDGAEYSFAKPFEEKGYHEMFTIIFDNSQ